MPATHLRPPARGARDGRRATGYAVGVAVWLVDMVLFSGVGTAAQTRSPFVVVAGSLPVLALLLLRHRLPVAAALLVSVGVPATLVTTGWPPVLCVALGVFTAAARAPLRSSVVCLAVALAAHGFALVHEVGRMPRPDRAGALFGVGLIYVLLECTAWAVGRWSSANRKRAAHLERQKHQALADERARVSRELHDIVAHSVTVMLLHAAVGRRAVAQGAAGAAEESLRVIEDTGGQAVNELRRMLGLLRADAPTDGSEPLPTFDALPDLLDGMRRSGIDVDSSTTGEPRPLDPSVGLAAYRTVQEALTNTLRHAGTGAHATVEVHWSPQTLRVRVHDDSSGRPDPRLTALSTGTGLVGLAERVAIAGGHLQSGPRPGGGWGVDVVLPVTDRGLPPPVPAGDGLGAAGDDRP